MIRVLVLSSNLVFASGITRVIKNLIDYSDKSRIQYTIATLDDARNDMVDYFKSIDVEVVIIPPLSISGVSKVKAFLKDIIFTYQFDIIHSHFFQIDGIVFPIAKKNNIKFISHSHSSELSEIKWKAIRNQILFSRGSKQADYWAACSKLAGIALFGRKFTNSNKSLLVKNGIDCGSFEIDINARQVIRKEYGISDSTRLIGNIGRFSPTKNQQYLLYIIKALLDAGEDYKLMLVGNGPTYSQVLSLAKQLNIEKHVIFTGEKHNTPAYLSAFDVFVMPSIHEGLGITAIEAQANGLDCVISDTIPEEVDVTGIIRLPLSQLYENWADSIRKLPCIHHPEYNKMVVNAGYEIRDVAYNMQLFYLKILKNDKNKNKGEGIAMSIYRVSNKLYRHKFRLLPKMLYYVNYIMFGCVIPPSVKIGEGSRIAHSLGCVINQGSVIGENCYIMHNVTLGESGVVIGNNVFLGTGCVIQGPCSIGDDARIGANTYVNFDVPSGATVVGVKGRII